MLTQTNGKCSEAFLEAHVIPRAPQYDRFGD